MYMMNSLAGRGRELDMLRALRAARGQIEAEQAVARELPEGITPVLQTADFEPLLQRLRALPEPPDMPRLTAEDWIGALGIFAIVFLSTFPVILPFLFISKTALALRVSNLIAIGMLFLTGYVFGRVIGHRPMQLGIAMVLIGCALTSLAIFLGG
jgi:VIT1/CCC1 family predicted Fe2+/Mn2+ transporter